MNDDQPIRDYQDDLDTDPNKHDRITEELTDDLADTAGIPRHELAHELKGMAMDEEGHGTSDDQREAIEDADQEMGEGGKS